MEIFQLSLASLVVSENEKQNFGKKLQKYCLHGLM